MQRMGMVIGPQPDKSAEYKRPRAAVWPEILKLISECKISNCSFYLQEPENIGDAQSSSSPATPIAARPA